MQVVSKLNDHLLFFENKPELLKNEKANLLILPYFYLRTMGNPLTLLNFLDNLKKVKYLYDAEKKPSVCIISEQFREALESEETINIEAPICWVQVNGPIIDSLSCLESLVLKFASVAGDIFDI
jgi:adenylate cyclase 10